MVNRPFLKSNISTGDGFWNTPQHIKDYIYFHYNINFDPCPVEPTFDGLQIEWKENNFVNPPFHETEKWINKIIEEQKKGKNTVLLIPARTCTGYFHELILPNVSKIVFFKGRIRYVSQKDKMKTGASPWPSMLCIFEGVKSV